MFLQNSKLQVSATPHWRSEGHRVRFGTTRTNPNGRFCRMHSQHWSERTLPQHVHASGVERNFGRVSTKRECLQRFEMWGRTMYRFVGHERLQLQRNYCIQLSRSLPPIFLLHGVVCRVQTGRKVQTESNPASPTVSNQGEKTS